MEVCQRFRDSKLGYKFRRQHGIGPYITDFCCPQLKLIIEIDGEGHNDPKVQQHDEIREKYLQDQGFIIKHYTGRQINEHLEETIEGLIIFCNELNNH